MGNEQSQSGMEEMLRQAAAEMAEGGGGGGGGGDSPRSDSMPRSESNASMADSTVLEGTAAAVAADPGGQPVVATPNTGKLKFDRTAFCDAVHSVIPDLPESLAAVFALRAEQLYAIGWPLIDPSVKAKGGFLCPPATPSMPSLSKGGCEELLHYVRKTTERVVNRESTVTAWDMRVALVAAVVSQTPSTGEDDLATTDDNIAGPFGIDSDDHVATDTADLSWLLLSADDEALERYIDSASLSSWLSSPAPAGLREVYRRRLASEARAKAGSLLLKLALICGDVSDIVDSVCALCTLGTATPLPSMHPVMVQLREVVSGESLITVGPACVVAEDLPFTADAFALFPNEESADAAKAMMVCALDDVVTLRGGTCFDTVVKEVTLAGLGPFSSIALSSDKITLWCSKSRRCVILNADLTVHNQINNVSGAPTPDGTSRPLLMCPHVAVPSRLHAVGEMKIGPVELGEDRELNGCSVSFWVEPATVVAPMTVLQLSTEGNEVFSVSLQHQAAMVVLSVQGVQSRVVLPKMKSNSFVCATSLPSGEWIVTVNGHRVPGRTQGVPVAHLRASTLKLLPGVASGCFGGVALWDTAIPDSDMRRFARTRRLHDGAVTKHAVLWCPMEEKEGTWLCEVAAKTCLAIGAGSCYFRNSSETFDERREDPATYCTLPLGTGGERTEVLHGATWSQYVVHSTSNDVATTYTYCTDSGLISQIGHTPSLGTRCRDGSTLYILHDKCLTCHDVCEVEIQSAVPAEPTPMDVAREYATAVVRIIDNPSGVPPTLSHRCTRDTADGLFGRLMTLLNDASAMPEAIVMLVLTMIEHTRIEKLEAHARKNLFATLRGLTQHSSRAISQKALRVTALCTQLSFDLFTLEELIAQVPYFPDIAAFTRKLLRMQKADILCEVAAALSLTEHTDTLSTIVTSLIGERVRGGAYAVQLAQHVLESCSRAGKYPAAIVLPAAVLIVRAAGDASVDKDWLSVLNTLVKCLPALPQCCELPNITFPEKFLAASVASSEETWQCVLDASYCTGVEIKSNSAVRVHAVPTGIGTPSAATHDADTLAKYPGGVFLLQATGPSTMTLNTHVSFPSRDDAPHELRCAVASALNAVLARLMAKRTTLSSSMVFRSPVLRGGLSTMKPSPVPRQVMAEGLLAASQDTSAAYRSTVTIPLQPDVEREVRALMALCVRFSDAEPSATLAAFRNKINSTLQQLERCESIVAIAEYAVKNITPCDSVALSLDPRRSATCGSLSIVGAYRPNQRVSLMVDEIISAALSKDMPRDPQLLEKELRARADTADIRRSTLSVILDELLVKGTLSASECQAVHATIADSLNTGGYGFYLDEVFGCGSSHEDALRQLFHRLITTVLSQLNAALMRVPAHRLVSDPAICASVYVRLLTLLCQSWEGSDMDVMSSSKTLKEVRRLLLLESIAAEREAGFPRSNSLDFSSKAQEDAFGAVLESVMALSSVDLIAKNKVFKCDAVASTVACDRGTEVILQGNATRLTRNWSSSNSAVGVQYFEVTFPENAKDMFIGLIHHSDPADLEKLPTQCRKSVLYDSNGNLWLSSSTSGFGLRFSGGSTVGLGVVQKDNKVFITIDGQYAGTCMVLPSRWSLYPTFGWKGTKFGIVNTGEGPFAFDRRCLHPFISKPFTFFGLQDVAAYTMHFLACRAAMSVQSGGVAFVEEITQAVCEDLKKLIDIRASSSASVGSAVRARITYNMCDSMIQRLMSSLGVLATSCGHMETVQSTVIPALDTLISNSRSFDARSTALELLRSAVGSNPQAHMLLLDRLMEFSCQRSTTAPPKSYVPRWSSRYTCPERISISDTPGCSTASVKELATVSMCADPPLPMNAVTSFVLKIDRPRGSGLGSQYYVGVAADEYRIWTEWNTKKRKHMVWAIHDMTERDVMEHCAPLKKFAKDRVLFMSGDWMTITVDTINGTLSAARNDVYLGTVFTGIPTGTVLRPFARVYNVDAVVSLRPHPRPVQIIVNPQNVVTNNVALLIRAWMVSDRMLPNLLENAKTKNMGPLLRTLGLASEHGTFLYCDDGCEQRVSLRRFERNLCEVSFEDTGESRVINPNLLKSAPLTVPHLTSVNPDVLRDAVNYVIDSFVARGNSVFNMQSIIQESQCNYTEILKCEAAQRRNLTSQFLLVFGKLAVEKNRTLDNPYTFTPRPFSFSSKYRSEDVELPAEHTNQLMYSAFAVNVQRSSFCAYSAQPLPLKAETSITVRLQKHGGKASEFEAPVYIGVIDVPWGEEPELWTRADDLHSRVRHPRSFLLGNIASQKYSIPRLKVPQDDSSMFRPGDVVTFKFNGVKGTMHGELKPRGSTDDTTKDLGLLYDTSKSTRLFFFVYFVERGISCEILNDNPPLRATSSTDMTHVRVLGNRHSCDICKRSTPHGDWYQCTMCPYAYDICSSCFKAMAHPFHPFACMSPTHLSRPALTHSYVPQEGCQVYALHQGLNITGELLLSGGVKATFTNQLPSTTAMNLHTFTVQGKTQRLDFGLLPVRVARELLEEAYANPSLVTSSEKVTRDLAYFGLSNAGAASLHPTADSPFNPLRKDTDFGANELLGLVYDSAEKTVMFQRDGAFIKPYFRDVPSEEEYLIVVITDASDSHKVVIAGQQMLCTVKKIDPSNGMLLLEAEQDSSVQRWQSVDTVLPAVAIAHELKVSLPVIWHDTLEELYYPATIVQIGANSVRIAVAGTTTMTVSPNNLYRWDGGVLKERPIVCRANDTTTALSLPTGELCALQRLLLNVYETGGVAASVIRSRAADIVKVVTPFAEGIDGDIPSLAEIDTGFSYDDVAASSSVCRVSTVDNATTTIPIIVPDVGHRVTIGENTTLLNVVDVDAGLYADDEGEIVMDEDGDIRMVYETCEECAAPLMTPYCSTGKMHIRSRTTKQEYTPVERYTPLSQPDLLAALSRLLLMLALPHATDQVALDAALVFRALGKCIRHDNAKCVVEALARREKLTYSMVRSCVAVLLRLDSAMEQNTVALFILREFANIRPATFTNTSVYAEVLRAVITLGVRYPDSPSVFNDVVRTLLCLMQIEPNPHPSALQQLGALADAPKEVLTLLLGEAATVTGEIVQLKVPVPVYTVRTFATVVQASGASEAWPTIDHIVVAPTRHVEVKNTEGTMVNSTTLQMGKMMSSVGAFEGCVYYEVILPSASPIAMGWGTAAHATQSSGRHVGSDAISWSYRPFDGTVMHRGEPTRIPTTLMPKAGDVLGTYVDLRAMTITWMLNGEVITTFPIVHSLGELHAYLSCSCAPGTGCDMQLLLRDMRFIPKFCSTLDGGVGSLEDDLCRQYDQMRAPTHTPRPYAYYVQLVAYLDELSASGAEELSASKEEATTPLSSATPYWAKDDALERLGSYPLVAETMKLGTDVVAQHIRNIEVFGLIAERVLELVDCSNFESRFGHMLQTAQRMITTNLRQSMVSRQLRGIIMTSSNTPCEIPVDFSSSTSDFPRSHAEALHHSVLGQVLRALNSFPRAYYMKPMFKVVGSAGMDMGGLYRNAFSEMGEEIMLREAQCYPHSNRHYMGLFSPTSAEDSTVMPTSQGAAMALCTSREGVTMYRNLGKLMGGVVLSQGDAVIPADFPVFFWKFMVGETLTFDDYNTVDKDCEKTVQNTVTWYMADPEEVEEHYPGITAAAASVADKSDEAALRDAVEKYFVHVHDAALGVIRDGLQSVIPSRVLQLMPWRDLMARVCGVPDVTADFLLSEINYAGGVPDRIQRWLSNAIRSFSNEERCLFLKFVSGQRRPPLHSKIQVSYNNGLSGLPTARTCGYLLELRRATSEKELVSMLLQAIRNCQDFGFL
eukprot:PhM_4_TR13660/c0_g1_i1/m.26980